jgi:probable F420-dependent oxidoreductase
VLVHKAMATLDVLSEGRVEIGLGAGWMRSDYQAAGLPYDGPAARIERLEESVVVLKGLFGPGPLTFDGAHYRIDGLDGLPKPVQRPHPPLFLGGGGRRSLSLAGREADIVGLAPRPNDPRSMTAAATAEKIGWVREAAGDRFEELELSAMVTVVVADDHTRAAERLATERGWGAAAAPEVLEMPSVLLGPVDRIVEGLEARRDRYQLCYFVVSDEDMDAFAPVVVRLAGR